MKKEHIYELVDNSQDDEKVVAELWWNGKKVECSKPGLIDMIKEASYGATPNQGITFLENLPNVYRSGYLHFRKKKESDVK